jgi:hypothetical protein
MKEKDTIHGARLSSSHLTEVVADALRGLEFGTVKIIVHEGILVRVERTENRQLATRLRVPKE